MESNDKKFLVIIPCFNEARGLKQLLQQLLKEVPGVLAVVIDDGSTDDSFQIASSLVRTIRLPINLGIGGAVQAGIKLARLEDFDLCLQLDGDGQHPPGEIKKFLEAYSRTGCSLIIGSRFLAHEGFQSTWLRRMGIALLRFLIKSLYRYRITDPTSGFRLMDRKAIELFCREYPYDYPEPVSIAYCLENGLKVQEIDVQMRPRESGDSSIRGLSSFVYMVKVSFQIMMVRLTRVL